MRELVPELEDKPCVELKELLPTSPTQTCATARNATWGTWCKEAGSVTYATISTTMATTIASCRATTWGECHRAGIKSARRNAGMCNQQCAARVPWYTKIQVWTPWARRTSRILVWLTGGLLGAKRKKVCVGKGWRVQSGDQGRKRIFVYSERIWAFFF